MLDIMMKFLLIFNQHHNKSKVVMLLRNCRYFIRQIKNIQPEQWVVKPTDFHKRFEDTDTAHLNIKYYVDVKKQLTRKIPEEQVRPYTAKMGPITVPNPKIHDKVYRWCSCGLSLKQPFCDSSHDGTVFKPFKFTVQQNVKEMKLCGCKLTSNRPFCDGKACLSQDTE